MSEKPITQRIKDRLAAYTAMLRDIDNQLERLDRMEMTMASPPGPDLTGMPRGSGTPSDRTGMMVERKMELEEQIDRLKAEEKQERNAIEGLILQLSDPDERAVILLFYMKEKTIDEVATITGLTSSNIKVKLHRIRKKLFVVLKGMEEQ